MIKLIANIDVDTSTEKILAMALSSGSSNNISADISSLRNIHVSDDTNPFILGKTRFSDNKPMVSSLSYYMSQEMSQTDGTFYRTHSIRIVPETEISSLYIYFSDTEYPTRIQIGVDVYANDNEIFYTEFDTPKATPFNVIFSKMNGSNKQLVIKGVTPQGISTITIDEDNLIDVEYLQADRSNETLPNFGIYASNGRVKFKADSEFRLMAENRMLKDGQPIEYRIVNTENGKSQRVGSQLTKSWDYDNYKSIASVESIDKLLTWQNINMPGIEPKANRVTMLKLLDVFNEHWLGRNSIYGRVGSRFARLDSASKWNQISKIAEVCGTYVYSDRSGYAVSHTDDDISQPIIIPHQFVYGPIENKKILTNTITSVGMQGYPIYSKSNFSEINAKSNNEQSITRYTRAVDDIGYPISFSGETRTYTIPITSENYIDPTESKVTFNVTYRRGTIDRVTRDEIVLKSSSISDIITSSRTVSIGERGAIEGLGVSTRIVYTDLSTIPPTRPKSINLEISIDDFTSGGVVALSHNILLDIKTLYVGDTVSTETTEETNFKLHTNELFNTMTTCDDENIFDYMNNHIVEQYKNGRELVKLRVPVYDYNYQDGTKAISVSDPNKKMLFNIEDIVIPYIWDNGSVPISHYKNGQPKQFMVIRNNVTSKGAVWQDLTLLEIGG